MEITERAYYTVNHVVFITSLRLTSSLRELYFTEAVRNGDKWIPNFTVSVLYLGGQTPALPNDSRLEPFSAQEREINQPYHRTAHERLGS